MNLIEKVELILESKKSNKVEEHFKNHLGKYVLGGAALLGGAKYIDKKEKEAREEISRLNNLKRAAWKKHKLEQSMNKDELNNYRLKNVNKYINDNTKDPDQAKRFKDIEDFLNKNENSSNIEKFKKLNDLVDEHKDSIKNGTNFIVRQFID